MDNVSETCPLLLQNDGRKGAGTVFRSWGMWESNTVNVKSVYSRKGSVRK